MINFMSLLRPPGGQSLSAGQSAGNGAAGSGQPLNLFASLIQKLLGTSTPPVTQSGLSLPDTPADKARPAASAGEPESRPLKKGSKDQAEVSPAIIAVLQPDLQQVANLMPFPAASTGVPLSPPPTDINDGSAEVSACNSSGMTDTAGQTELFAQPLLAAPLAPTAPAIVSAQPPVQFTQPALEPASLFAQPPVGSEAAPVAPTAPLAAPPVARSSEGNILARHFNNLPRSGSTSPANPGTPDTTGAPVLPGTHGMPVTIDASSVKSSGGVSDLFRSVFTPAPKASIIEAPPVLVGDIKGDMGGVLDTQTVDASPVAAPESNNAAPESPQMLPPAMPLDIMPVIQTLTLESIDPSVIPRATGGQPLKGSDPLRRRSVDSKESGVLSAGNEATAVAPSAGFFTGVIRDMLGILSDTGTKKGSSDPKENGPSGMKTGAARVAPDPLVTDVPVGPAKKAGADRSQESQPVSATDITPAAHQQVDLTALRTSQGALNNPAISDKPESASPAAPLRELPSPYAPLPPEVSRRIADQVVGKLKLQVDGAVSEIRMTLKPPSLGEVQLSVHVEDSRMQAQISVSQQVVKTALEAHMPQLRMALQEHGIEIQRIDVMLPEQSLQRDGTNAGGDRAGRKGGRRSFSGDDPEAYQGAKDMGYNTIELIM
jgi:hypothetical protein